MTKKHMWLKLLSLLLVCGMILGCFAGCSKDENQDDDEDEEIEELRDELDRYRWNGLKIYLSEDFEEVIEDDYGVEYENEDEDMTVSVRGFWVDDELGGNITSAKKLMEAWIGDADDEEDVEDLETGKENGTPYFYADADGETGVAGFYYEDGYGWMVTVMFEDEDQKDEAIKYATLGEISKVPEKPSDDDYDYDYTYEDDYDEYPDIEVPAEPAREQVTLTVWTPEYDQSSGWLEDRLYAFEAAHPEYEITWKIGVCGEGDVGNVVRADPSAAADVFMYANDQLGYLYEAGGLCKLGGSYLDQVLADNSEVYINSVTYTDGEVYGFPMTCNTWFMYYNKDVYTEEDIKTMDSLLEKGTVAMQLGTAWYTAAFFSGNGGTIFGEYGLDASAGFNFGGQIGYGAAEAMINMANHPNFVDDASGTGVAGMCDGTVDAMFSGSWDYDYLYQYMGDKLGCAPLPTVTIGGKQVQLKAFAGSKAVGVNPYCDNQKAAMQLAAFLASEESQLERFELRGVTPAHKNLAYNNAVLACAYAVTEMAVMENCATIQPVIPEMSSFWMPMGTFGGSVMNGDVYWENYKDMVDCLNNQLNGEGL